MASHTSIVKAGDFILRTPVLRSIFVPAAKLFCAYSGYRQLGLKFDDLIHEENPTVQKALSRLPKDEIYARNFRMLTAAQCGITHHLLSADKALKPSEDTPYLLPYLLELEAEAAERVELDNVEVAK
uniref:Cytochrome b-c1 complex subunit 7 n=1 Tax=Cyberlindnera jadinii TaxID=4903 RepID=QCR7_CYBJA|nr:RecName: Full=Cytochrome b-c1 complex subunit 7; AltName: Full=Complex III subunit 7; AltName: Full=Complex III subunit VII; AltName: Full=Ubiquinol-cytochrome c reductase complex 14 kDa protein [Cyberlindnera jadinii]AAA86879.1 ubiquinol-cytochrome c oxidoreductase subunit VII [Cyberlindnera jadinii]